jgi:hypothetical protein
MAPEKRASIASPPALNGVDSMVTFSPRLSAQIPFSSPTIAPA